MSIIAATIAAMPTIAFSTSAMLPSADTATILLPELLNAFQKEMPPAAAATVPFLSRLQLQLCRCLRLKMLKMR